MRKGTKCTWNGIEYPSVSAAAFANDISVPAMKWRLDHGYTSDADVEKRTRITPDLEVQVVALHKDGKSRLEIQEQLGITYPTIRKILAMNNHKSDIRSGNYGRDESTPDEKQKAIELYNSGLTAQQVASKLGYSKKWALDVIREHIEKIDPKFGSDISAEKFIKEWQAADTIAGLAITLNKSHAWVLSRGYNFRVRGVPLKQLRSARGYDWDDLAELAAMMLKLMVYFRENERCHIFAWVVGAIQKHPLMQRERLLEQPMTDGSMTIARV